MKGHIRERSPGKWAIFWTSAILRLVSERESGIPSRDQA